MITWFVQNIVPNLVADAIFAMVGAPFLRKWWTGHKAGLQAEFDRVHKAVEHRHG